MNQHLQSIFNFIQQDESLTAEEKSALLKSLKDADKELEITAFKLDRTEKVKRTTAILLEETIEELEQKRKAVEAQNRELEIESSLERVRTVAMAMQQPDDLLSICEILFNELQKLGFSELRNTMINIHDDVKGSFLNYDFSAYAGKTITTIFYNSHPLVESHVRQIKSSHDAFAEMIVTGKELEDWRKFRKENGEPDDTKLDEIKSLYYYFYSVVKGDIGISNFEPVSEKQLAVLKRFSNVFDLAYKRYTDITKAEAQAREAQIENALEKVRSRTMAMQRSEELPEAANNLFLQVQALGIPAWSAGYCIWDEDKQGITFWMSSEGLMQPPAHAPVTENPSFIHMKEAYERGDAFHVEEVGGEALVTHYQYMRTLPVVGEILDSIIAAGHPLPTFQIFHCVYFSQGFLLFITYETVPKAHEIFKRFGKVFDQTYTRFLDLQKAEAQAREAQIELALERVRARTMAMQKSDELSETAYILYQQFKELRQDPEQLTIGIINEDKRIVELWLTLHGNEMKQMIEISIDEPFVTSKLYAAWKQQKNSLVIDLSGKDLKAYNDYRNGLLKGIRVNNDRTEERRIMNFAFFSKGQLSVSAPEPLSEEGSQLLQRFAKVFEQTYTRFLDLQKAEAQAREAQIEASLERVRSKAMSMHGSEDLAATIGVFYREQESLSFTPRRCGVGLLDKETRIGELSTMSTTEQGGSIELIGKLKMTGHPVLEAVYDNWLAQKEYHPVLRGNEIKEYYQLIRPQIAFPEYQSDVVQYGYFFFFNEGGVYAWTDKELAEEEIKIYRRFTSVLSLTYKRYKDLKQAEAQAREAQIEASLERVRSRTMSMQRSDELTETAAVCFNQLVLLGIEPNRLYIGIIKDDNGHIEFWATDEDGSKVSTQFIGDTGRNASMKKMYDAWKAQKKSLTIDMQGKELNDYFQYMTKELKVPFTNGLSQKRRIQTIALFGKGFLGMASPDDQPEETTHLLERFAAVFNLTYTRFNDLQISEAHAIQAEEDLIKLQKEKKKTEDALNELQATQKQLIQSEKMASLGELTAGIAHEIQNPLNFVNNFSEVNTELIDEMQQEMDKGNYEDAKAISNDIKDNEQKINHHGKRADSIVKGMLQHSRSSTATKEPTNINALTDEYLRLAYHGLRAKDNSFNATLKTDFDESIVSINIVPQDIGRVLLNLYNNAFYAVNEKQKAESLKLKAGGIKYEPTVYVSTKKINDHFEIRVTDNGSGIPQKAVDKIFQPFFTTKPTGQGTGLGLSLAYDIVKAHGGVLKVETKEGKGCEFIIQIPF